MRTSETRSPIRTTRIWRAVGLTDNSRITLPVSRRREIPFASLGEPFESDFPLCLPGERSIGKDRISEILVLVNITDKTPLPEFSVRLFVSVLLLGSQVCAPNGEFRQSGFLRDVNQDENF